jgi:hypothetical protein
LEEQHLDRQSVENVIQSSGERFQIIEHKGRSFIQRSVR